MGDFKRLKLHLLPEELVTAPAAVEYDDRLVSPFATPRATDELSILIVGSGKTGKKTLSQLLRRATGGANLRIYSTSSLPLPREGATKAHSFDFVIILVNMVDAYSCDVARMSLERIRLEAIYGRCCVVCTHADRTSAYSVLPESVENLAMAFQLPVLYADLLRGSSAQLAARIHKLLKISAGLLASDGGTPSAVISAEPMLVTPTQILDD